MSGIASPPTAGDTTRALIFAAFCEACERYVAVRTLIEDPRHQTRRQGTAMTHLLQAGLASVQGVLRSTREAIKATERDPDLVPSTLAEIGIALAGLRQIHGHLGYLGMRWPLGTADLFVRKLVAEGLPLPVPTLCATDRPDGEIADLGRTLAGRLLATGLPAGPLSGATPLLALPVTDLLEPLSWPALLLGLAEAIVDADADDGVPGMESQQGGDPVRQARIAALAARTVGEPVHMASAVRALRAGLAGGPGWVDLGALHRASLAYAQPLGSDDTETTPSGYLHGLLDAVAEGNFGWGRKGATHRVPEDEALLGDAAAWAAARLPAPSLASSEELDLLVSALDDGRPINAYPPDLGADFAQRLAAMGDADAFYALVGRANERPCSLAAILAAGWRYKLQRTHALCRELVLAETPWERLVDTMAGHVLERWALLAQSMEAAYVQQVFAREHHR